MKNLTDQVIIVTGGAAGIGGAITTVLTERGASVVAVDIDEDAGKQKVNSNPEQIAFLKGDISKLSVAEEAVKMAIAKFGKLTGVVNNAHASKQKPLMALTEDDWALSMDTGLKGTLNFMKAAYPELKKTKGVMPLLKKRFAAYLAWQQTNGQKMVFVSILFAHWL